MNTKPRYVVQAYCTGMGWTDSRYNADTLVEAQELERQLLARDSAWMPGKRETRIRDREANRR